MQPQSRAHDLAMPPGGDAHAAWRLALIQDHFQSPRHRGAIPEADVVMPGGNPGCGDVVVVYLKGSPQHLEAVSFEGEGCTVSQAATSMLLEHVQEMGLDLGSILALDVSQVAEWVGDDVMRARPRCATLGLATLKGAVRALLRRHGISPDDPEVPQRETPR